MTAGVYRCPLCGNTTVSYNYELRTLVCTKCKAPSRNLKMIRILG